MKHLTAVLLVGGIFMFSGCGYQERMDLLIGMYGELEQRLAEAEKTIEALSGKTDRVVERIRTRRLEVLDSSGEIRAVLTVGRKARNWPCLTRPARSEERAEVRGG